MEVDDTVRVKLDDNDIREAIEQYVRMKLSTGPDTQKLDLLKLDVFDSSKPNTVGEEPEPVSWGLHVEAEFKPAKKPVTRSA